MSDYLYMATLQHRAARPGRRGKLLRLFRLDAADAAGYRRKGNMSAASSILRKAHDRTLRTLLRRHGAARVMKKSHLINAVLDRVEQAEQQRFRSE